MGLWECQPGAKEFCEQLCPLPPCPRSFSGDIYSPQYLTCPSTAAGGSGEESKEPYSLDPPPRGGYLVICLLQDSSAGELWPPSVTV